MNLNHLSAISLFCLLATATGCDNPPAPPAPTPEPPAPSVATTSAAKAAQMKTTMAAIKAARAARPQPAKAAEIPAPADVGAPPADATKHKSGLVTKVLKKGTGDKKPTEHDKVSVHYTGWTKDGKMFDSSVARKRPASFGVKGVIAGWTEALQMMVVGEKRRLWIPGKLAYGDRPRMGQPSGQLTFDVELLEVVEGPKPPEVPKDVAAPPATAKKTKSGLAYRILSKGPGTTNPKATDRVRVHYTGWSKDGKMFDSSVMRGQPATFGLNQVIKGWTEGVQLLKVGDKARFWIPGNLAYGDKPKRPGAPSGQLTFDIELVQIL
ncbi:MAG: FKBP-type peptidyl-prolyl cis-trans isomerase [Polyangiaceae bacterium]